jgi:thioredoxin reductase (NADPH)
VKHPLILAVDDDRQVLSALKRDLRSRYRHRHGVLSTSSGEEALSTIHELKAQGEDLALVISDQRMPGMLGVELLAQCRQSYPVARRVLLTAYSDIDAVVRGINEAHIDHYFSKPWDPPEDHLYPVLDDLLESWEVERKPETSGLRLVGFQWSPRSHAIKDFLASNLIPYRWLDVELNPGARTLLDSVEATTEELPALFLEDGAVLRNPSPLDIARGLGLTLSAAHDVYDLLVVGAGPAGLGAAVYGASEGLRTLLLDRHGPGGQAGTSSRIENYLGFPAGVSGSELTRRAITQAQRLGAEFLAPIEVVGLSVDAGYKRVELAGGRTVLAKSVLIVTGMAYRKLDAAGVAEHTGAGVYYGAASTEAQAFRGRQVFVVGGGNSAGQAAMHLSRFAEDVHIVVRRDGLDTTMSRYLVDQIEATPNIHVLARSVLHRVEGEGRVERVTLADVGNGAASTAPADAVFVMIGARPRTDWLPPAVLRDRRGFVLAGRELAASEDFPRIWREQRDPLPLETSVPGIFAAGDVRAGAINRVASAVAEGAMAVKLVHEYLALT